MKKTILSFFLLGMSVCIHAQHFLTRQNNSIRPGDEIIKQQVEYKDPGRAGQHVLWDFSSLQPVNETYRLTYSETYRLNDSLYLVGKDTIMAHTLRNSSLITGEEHYTRYYYRVQDDGIYHAGHTNPVSRMTYAPYIPQLPFDMGLGDKQQSAYTAQAWYSGTEKIYAEGEVSVEIDAFGIMALPGKDTLRHVVRVRIGHVLYENADSLANSYSEVPDNVRADFERVAIKTETETFRWYEKGYRYPVFETIRTLNKSAGEENERFATAFFYPPQAHYYLENDPDNLALLELMEKQEEENHPGEEQQPELEIDPWENFSYNFYPNPVKSLLTVEYYVATPTTVDIALYDMQGGLLNTRRENHLQAGIYSAQLDMATLIKGNYLLKIATLDKTVNEIIIKK